MDLTSKKIAVIGGAGLVGSHIVDQLAREPASEIIVYDNLVRGTDENLTQAVRDPKVRVVKASMTDRESLRRELSGVDGVFLLASLWLGDRKSVV